MRITVGEMPSYERERFIRECWLPRRPTIIRDFITEQRDWLQTVSPEMIVGWAAPPVTARLYLAEPDLPRDTRSTEIAPVTKVPLLLAKLRGQAKRFILYLSELERIVPELADICAQQSFGSDWRRNGSRFSLCFPGRATGLGLHADRTDSLLVQLCGRRRWKVWAPERLPHGYLHEVMTGCHHSATRTSVPADVELELRAGDALYVPVTYGHEGYTPDDAPSFSFAMATAWQAVTPLYLLRSVVDITAEVEREVTARLDELLQLMPDPPPGEDPIAWSVDFASPILATLSSVDITPSQLRSILSRAPSDPS